MTFAKIYNVAPGAPACGPRKGTYAGAMAHSNRREPKCDECKAAHAKYKREHRHKHKTSTGTLVSDELLLMLLRAAPGELREKVIQELQLTWIKAEEFVR